MNSRKIKRKDYKLLLSLDKKVYPTKSPVTEKNLSDWYKINPEFGIVFEKKGTISGLVIAIPLNEKAWKKLIEGKLLESALGKDEIFSTSRDNKIGIHIYHIEKISKGITHLHKKMLICLKKIVLKIKKQKNKNLKVIGFSGLCVTKEGINLFEKTLKCKEGKFKSEEHILEKNGKKIILTTKYKKIIKKYKLNGYTYQNRCKMLITTPNKKSIVWDYLN